MEKQKMCSFRLDPNLFEDFKGFCTRNKTTIKGVLTKFVEITLNAEKIENSDYNGSKKKLLEL